MKSCVVCVADKCSYKCPICKSFYCSAACCKVHKTNCSQILTDSKPHEVLNSQQNTYSNDYQILTVEERQMLQKSTLIKGMLRSKRLRADITSVDSSSKRQQALKSLRSQNPEFENFVQEMLQVIRFKDKI
jgi:hypothetical protein